MNAEDLPIDIHYNKLLDWLINRRHCQQQWQGAALSIREKINTAIQDMPPVDEITELLRGTYVNYFHCQKIVSLLKETDDGSKNIFGWYSSKRMKDWLDIIKCYEKDGVYLAEAAQMLMRNVNYEIPALKRQIAKCQQVQKDCTRKEAEYASIASEIKDKYHSSCRQMGIKGQRVKTELVDLVKDMTPLYAEIERSAVKLRPASQYYRAFVSFMLGSPQKGAERINLLMHFIEKGNTTTYEWKYGRPPAQIEETVRDYGIDDEKTEEEKADEIDWGDIGTEADTINFDISVADTGADMNQAAERTDAADGIDWGDDGTVTTIEVVSDGTVEVPSNEDTDIARSSNALTILDNTETRNLLINQLEELAAFLNQRVQELSQEGNVLSDSQFSSAPTEVQLDLATVKSMLSDVNELLAHMTSKKMQNLFLIRSSPSYVHRMADSLSKILSDSEKMTSLSRLMVLRREEAMEEEKQIQPQIDLLRKHTHELQKQIEDEISKKYKNRRVNIMGEINTL